MSRFDVIIVRFIDYHSIYFSIGITLNTITLLQPDDWHAHLRDGLALKRTVPDLAKQFARAICMPNLVPPVKTVEEAISYRERIMAHVPEGVAFDPRMVLYFTDQTSPAEVKKLKTPSMSMPSSCIRPVQPPTRTMGSATSVKSMR